MSNLLLLSIVLCLIVGSTIDTSNICIVRAAGDLAAGKPAVAASLLFTTACASVVFFLNTEMGLLRHPAPWSYPTFFTFAGATLFGAGALINGACAIGTMSRLARGDIGYFATIAGAVGVSLVVPAVRIRNQAPDIPMLTGATWLWIVLAFSAVFMILSWRHLRIRRLGSYAVLGVLAAVVTNWQGNWTWLTLVHEMHIGAPVEYAAIACVAAVLIGAGVTAVLTGHYRFVRPDPRTMAREAFGGGLMAAGALLIPGGNDALLVFGVPSGSPRAIVGYFAMFAVLLVGLRLRPWLHRQTGWAWLNIGF